MDASASKKRILILGGGFGGVATARHLEGLFRRRPDVEIVLVSRDNFVLMTPLLFEVFSGTLDLRVLLLPRPRLLAHHPVRRGHRPGHRPGPARGPPGVPREAWRAGLRPAGPGPGVQDQPGDDPRLGARLHVQDPRRRPAAPQPRHRAVRAGRRGNRPATRSATPHVRGHRRRAGRGGAARRADRLRGRHHASLQARGPRRGPFPPAPGRRPHHAGNRPDAGGVRRPGARRAARGGPADQHPGAGHRAGQGPPGGRNHRRGHDRPGGGERPQPGGRGPAGGEGQARAHRGRADPALPESPGGVGAGRLRLDPRPRRQALPQPGPARLAPGQGAGPEHRRRRWTAGRPSRSSTRPSE